MSIVGAFEELFGYLDFSQLQLEGIVCDIFYFSAYFSC
jgi:hypothetical protein